MRPSGTQIFPEVSFRGVFHNDIKRAWMKEIRVFWEGRYLQRDCKNPQMGSYHPGYKIRAGWWCSCVFQSSSSSPSLRWGQTGPSQWRQLMSQIINQILINQSFMTTSPCLLDLHSKKSFSKLEFLSEFTENKYLNLKIKRTFWDNYYYYYYYLYPYY